MRQNFWVMGQKFINYTYQLSISYYKLMTNIPIESSLARARCQPQPLLPIASYTITR